MAWLCIPGNYTEACIPDTTSKTWHHRSQGPRIDENEIPPLLGVDPSFCGQCTDVVLSA